MKQAVLFGNSAVAAVMHQYLIRDTDVQVRAFTVDREFIQEQTLSGLPVVPFDEVVELFPPAEHAMMIAVGYVRGNHLRAERCAQARQMGYRLFSYVSPKASIWEGMAVPDNCRIGDFASIAPFSHIGEDVYISTGACIGHHVVIKDHCFISSGVRIGGYSTIEPYTFIGLNATVRNRIHIARSCVIGAGAVILSDTQEKGVYIASPAEKLIIQSDEFNLG
jgi:sugar O-acyltransferase (sialic acid O-acetyltransferase NeuD family)